MRSNRAATESRRRTFERRAPVKPTRTPYCVLLCESVQSIQVPAECKTLRWSFWPGPCRIRRNAATALACNIHRRLRPALAPPLRINELGTRDGSVLAEAGDIFALSRENSRGTGHASGGCQRGRRRLAGPCFQKYTAGFLCPADVPIGCRRNRMHLLIAYGNWSFVL